MATSHQPPVAKLTSDCPGDPIQPDMAPAEAMLWKETSQHSHDVFAQHPRPQELFLVSGIECGFLGQSLESCPRWLCGPGLPKFHAETLTIFQRKNGRAPYGAYNQYTPFSANELIPEMVFHSKNSFCGPIAPGLSHGRPV